MIIIDKKISIIVVLGATASGKTALSIKLAKKFDGEIISADSMQIYKLMNIGTAKPTIEEMDGVKHHLIDFAPIDKNFSVCEYCSLANKEISKTVESGKLPILTGGTGLYIDSLISGMDFGENDSDESLRNELFALAEEKGADALHDILRSIDDVSAELIHKNNIKRVVRAIEYQKVTGIKFSEHKERAINVESRFSPCYFMIDWDRDVLYERINKRVDIMIGLGLVSEAKRIYDMNLDRKLTAFSGIGYKELFSYFDGECTLNAAIEQIKQNSRRYAKRQLTWFRRNKEINLIKPDNLNDAITICQNFLKN